MIKAYLDIYELYKKKDGTPFRRMRIMAQDEKTGELFELFNVGMTPINLELFDVLLSLGKIKETEKHDDI